MAVLGIVERAAVDVTRVTMALRFLLVGVQVGCMFSWSEYRFCCNVRIAWWNRLAHIIL